MKKTIKILIPILAFSLIAYMVHKVVQKINYKNAVAQHIKTMPPFSYQTIEGNLFTNANLKQNTATVFLYFNSDCEHCQSEATQIKDNIEQLQSIQLVFISFEEASKIKAFATNYKLLNYNDIHFLCDNKVTFSTTFDVKSVPTMLIYDQNNNLIEKTKGEAKIEYILKKTNSK